MSKMVAILKYIFVNFRQEMNIVFYFFYQTADVILAFNNVYLSGKKNNFNMTS